MPITNCIRHWRISINTFRRSVYVLAIFLFSFGNFTKVFPILIRYFKFVFLFISEFYEEALSLVYDLTSKKISPDMWQVLELIYQVFQKNGFDHFVDMMPALHNYVTVDTPAFLSNENHVLAMFNMAKAVSIQL